MLRILYAGSPAPSAKTLEVLLKDGRLCKAGCAVAGVLTNPPSSQGRHKQLIPTAVASVATAAGIPVFTPLHLDSECREQIAPLKADMLVCFAYCRMFGPKFLALFHTGAINIHPSLLPKYRGCTPVPAAILNGDKETGISIQKLAQELDSGELLSQRRILLTGKETSSSLLEHVAIESADMLFDILLHIERTGALPVSMPQKGEPSYTKMLSKGDGRIDWKKSAKSIDAKIRAYTPDPGCWTMCGQTALRILKAGHVADNSGLKAGTVVRYDKKTGIFVQTGDGMLAVSELQWQAKKALCYKDFMNGCRSFIGTVLE